MAAANECTGCGCPFDRCGPMLWAQQRTCCPDCSHAKHLEERMMPSLFVAPQGETQGIALTLDKMLLRIGVGTYAGPVTEIGVVPLRMLAEWLTGKIKPLPPGVRPQRWEDEEG